MKKRFKDYPPNVPHKLIRALHAAGSIRQLERDLAVNSYYICELLNKGIEPNNPDTRVKLFLSRKKRKPPTPRPELFKGQKKIKRLIGAMAKRTRQDLGLQK